MSDPHISPFKARLLREMAEDFSYELGNAALVHERPDEAVVLYRRALEVNPRNAKVLGNLAAALARIGDEAGAREALGQADAAGPRWRGTAHFDLGRVYEMLGREDEADAMFRRAAEFDPEHAEATGRLLEKELRRNDAAAVLSLYRRIAPVDPTVLSGRQKTEIGVLLMERDEFEEALRLLDTAVDEGCGTLRCLVYRAVVLFCLERFDDALRAADLLIARFPENVNSFIEKAKCLIALGRFDDARATLEDRRVAPGDVWVDICRTRILAATGGSEEAVARYRALAATRPHPVLLLDLGVLLESRGEPQAALECYEAAAAGFPDEPWMSILCGSALEGLGRREQALERYRAGIAGTLRRNFIHQFIHDRAAAGRKSARAREAVGAA